MFLTECMFALKASSGNERPPLMLSRAKLYS